MSKNNISQLLAAPEKWMARTSGPNGILARLFIQIVTDLGISAPARWDAMMRDYILDPRNGIPNNTRDQTSARGNLIKELMRPQMTWKVFIKALRFLKITKIEIGIKATHMNGKTTLHSTAVDFGLRQRLDTPAKTSTYEQEYDAQCPDATPEDKDD